MFGKSKHIPVFIWLACLLAAATILTACSGDEGRGPTEEVVAGLGRDAGGVYGHAHHLGNLTGIFEGLATWGYSSEIVPQLAESWEVSPDGLTWTFHLKDGVKFHDGASFNARTAKNSLVMLSKKRPGHMGPVSEIKVVDDLTLQIIHTRPFASLLSEVAWFYYSMASPSAFDREGNITKPIGTGPFKQLEWIPDEKLVLVRNDSYWGKKPRLKKVTLKNMPDPSTRIMALETGEIDMIIDSGGVFPDDVKSLEENPDIEVVTGPQSMCNYLLFNCRKPPFSDLKVRRALQYAIDRQAMVETLLGVGVVASSLITSDVTDWHYPAFQTEYDPDKARKMLEEAGWVDADNDGVLEKEGRPFRVMMLLSTEQLAMGPDRMVAEFIQANLMKIGIDMKLQALEKATYYSKTSAGRTHDLLLWCYPFLGPHNVLSRSFHTKGDWNLRGLFYSDQRMDNLLETGSTIMDPAQRRKIYDEVQQITFRDAMIIPLSEAVLINAVRTRVKGYRPHPWFVINWREIYVDDE